MLVAILFVFDGLFGVTWFGCCYLLGVFVVVVVGVTFNLITLYFDLTVYLTDGLFNSF